MLPVRDDDVGEVRHRRAMHNMNEPVAHRTRSKMQNEELRVSPVDGDSASPERFELSPISTPDRVRLSPEGASDVDTPLVEPVRPVEDKDLGKPDGGVDCALADSDEDVDLSDTRKLIPESKPRRTSPADVKVVPEDDESALAIFCQVVIPFLIAGCGMVAAGVVLDVVQHWTVFETIPEIFILVPALLGLKGNLEMTLASRLSTLANLGQLDSSSDRWRIVLSNLALIQAQAAVVAFLASTFAIVLAWVPRGEVNWTHALVLCASSMSTAALASFVLGVIMAIVIVQSRIWHINPDNVATPIAASLGDLTTLAFLSTFGSLLLPSGRVINGVVVCLFVSACPLWCWLAAREHTTKAVLESGWTPVIMAMLISSGGGFILKFAVKKYSGIAVFQPVINGVGGNLVAVAASRLSTSLHRSGTLGQSQAGLCISCSPFAAFCSNDACSRAARVLLVLVVPGHMIFNSLIHVLEAGHTPITGTFSIVYLTAAVMQVSLLLWTCRWLVHSMWCVGVDPDNSAIPYLTALGDLSGTGLLAVAFALLDALGHPSA